MEDTEGDIGSVTKGKQGELVVLGKLLERGFKIYTPMVDTGIDCLVDVGEGNYKEIQVKYRENEPTFLARNFKPRENFYLICFLREKHGDDFWILPSKMFKELGKPRKVGTRDYIQLKIGKEGSETYNRLSANHSNWGMLLAGATQEVRKTVEGAWKRVEGPHFKQTDFEKFVLFTVGEAKTPISTTDIIDGLEDSLSGILTEADLERSKRNIPRWQNNVRFAIYQGLAKKELIRSVGKSRWEITDKGKEAVKMLELVHDQLEHRIESLGGVTKSGFNPSGYAYWRAKLPTPQKRSKTD